MTRKYAVSSLFIFILAFSFLALSSLTAAPATSDSPTVEPAPTPEPTTDSPVMEPTDPPVIEPPAPIPAPIPVPTPTPKPKPPVTGVGGVPVAQQFRFLGYSVSTKAINGGALSRSEKTEVKNFQSKFGLKQTGTVDKPTLRALDKYAGSARVPKRCITGVFTLCVNKFTRTVQAVSRNGNVLRVLDARFGRPGMETREGRFTVSRKHGPIHISTLYRVNMPYSIFFSGGEAIHFSQEFYNYPTSQSHGCVGTRHMDDQRWINKWSRVGATPVIVYNRAP